MEPEALKDQEMPVPKDLDNSKRLAVETERIKAAYRRRHCGDLYSWFTPGHLHYIQERERRVLNFLRRSGLPRLEDLHILEVGCYTGYWLGELVKWGARPENLTGIDLFSENLVTARSIQAPKVGLALANAAYLPFRPSSFDLVLQSLLFTSILDPVMKQAVAGELLRVLKPQGFILWYDYHANNPWNADVLGVKRKEIQRLFPHCLINLQRVTLAPPLARFLAPYSFLLCSLLEKLRFLNTHYLGIIQKAA
ncbi:MAG: class I SAM-dependent methyltransferase [Desulfobaccales bacterium]